MWTLVQIALRNVVRNRRRTLITLAALVVGVGVLVTMRGLLDGVQAALVHRVVEAQVGAVQVHRKGYLKNVLSNPLNLDFAADDAMLAKVRAIPGVRAVAPRIMFAGMIALGDQTLFLAALGLEPTSEYLVCPLREQTVTKGTFGATDDGVVITTELAKSIGATLGSDGALLAPDQNGSLNGENVHINGIMDLGFPGERKIGMIPLDLARRVLRMEGRATELAVAVDHIEDAPRVANALKQAFGDQYEVSTWDEIAPFVKQALALQDFMLRIIGAIFMVLMLLGVANTVLMSVLERTREVGTMMAVGVRRGSIMILFVLEAMGIGILGGLIGDALGVGIVTWMHARGIVITAPGQTVPFTIRPEITPIYLLTVLVVAAVGAMVFSLYPAWRASRLRPVEALAGG